MNNKEEPYGYYFNGRFYKSLDDLKGRTMSKHAQPIPLYKHPNLITEVIEKVEAMHPYKERGNPDSYSDYNQGWEDACDVILSKLKEK